jgi:type IV conjugative transfer system protein TraE
MSNVMRNNTLLKFGIIVFAAATIVSSITSYKAMHYSRTHIAPRSVAQHYWFSEREMSDSGVRLFTRQSFDLCLNYTPKSANKRFDELLSMIHTRYYDSVKKDLGQKLQTIDRMNVVSTYLIEEITHNEIEKKVKVKGPRRKTTYGKEMYSGVEEWTLSYEIIDSNFKIIKIQKT